MAENRAVEGSPDPILKEFKDVVEQNTLIGDCGRCFVRIEKLTQWMRSDTNTHKLLWSVYASNASKEYVNLPIQSGALTRSTSGIIIFSILLDLGHGALIDAFDTKDLLDQTLPLRKWSLQELYKSCRDRYPSPFHGEDAVILSEQFDRRQYAFCPPILKYGRSKDHQPDIVIPVKKGHKALINDKGGTASVWQICVLEEFVDEDLRTQITSSRFEDPKDNLGWRYRLALKTFQQENHQFYETETEAFKNLEGHEGMVKYLGQYCQKDALKQTTNYNILLEYGQLDLDEFFFDNMALPPTLPLEIRNFWDDIFDLVGALKKLHKFKVRRGGNTLHEYYGWHADIKPDNILRVNGKFKLADPGFASFKRVEGGKKLKEKQKQEHGDPDDTTIAQGGTVTYGAPECNFWKKQYNTVSVTRAIDIWSLGCVLSVAATWVVLGPQGVLMFQRLREMAILDLRREHPDLVPGDYFHNGDVVLPVVTHWHKYLRGCARGFDKITDGVLNLIDTSMLCKEGSTENSHRITAKELDGKLRLLLSETQPSPLHALPQSFCSSLQEIDIQSLEEMDGRSMPRPQTHTVRNSALPTNENMLSTEDRKAKKKSEFLRTPLLPTSHRSDAQRSFAVHQSSLSTRRERPNLAPQDLPMIVEPGDSSPAFSHFDQSTSSVLSTNPSINESDFRASLGSMPQVKTSTSRNSGVFNAKTASAPEKSNFQRRGTGGTSMSHVARAVSAPSGIPKQNPFQARAELDRQRTFFRAMVGKPPKKNGILTTYFKNQNRDLHFLVDDASCMAGDWDEAIFLLGILVDKAVGQDPDGMDMSFTNSKHHVKGSNNVEKFLQAMESARPNPISGPRTDITKRLGDMLEKYRNTFRQSSRYTALEDLRKLTIVILTDGKWEGMSNKHEIGKTIANFAKEMEKIKSGSLKARQVSFQFIQFGQDEEAQYRLQLLDDHLPYEEAIPDIVDTVDSRGDVLKMLLGSFRPEFDEQD